MVEGMVCMRKLDMKGRGLKTGERESETGAHKRISVLDEMNRSGCEIRTD